MTEKRDNKLVFLSFLLLFTLILFLYLPSFSNPPQGDWWETFFVFHQLDYAPFSVGFPYLVNHDAWRHGTFRPLAYPIQYFEYFLFGSSFVFYHLTNFTFYCLVLILLYLLGLQLGGQRAILIASLTLLALLFSHCDILTLTFHVFLIAGFAAFLLAFLLYLRYLKSGRLILLGVIAPFFLFGMFSYEIFIFWPPAIFLLAFLFPPPSSRRRRISVSSAILLVLVYACYGAVFLLTRSSGYNSGKLPGVDRIHLLTSAAFTFFNLLYTGVAVNLCPFLASPVLYKGYSEMSGMIPLGPPPSLARAAYLLGGVTLLLGGSALWRFHRKSRQTVGPLFFLLFLYLSAVLVLISARSTTNNYSHILRQFRYQYVPNVIIALAMALSLSSWRSPPRWARTGLLIIFLVALSSNFLLTSHHIINVGRRLSPLKELIINIRAGLDSGKINPQQPVFLPDGISTYFSHLCWNHAMGRKMWGTYQWIFSRRQLYSFTPSIKEAAWVVDPEKRNYYPKNHSGIRKSYSWIVLPDNSPAIKEGEVGGNGPVVK